MFRLQTKHYGSERRPRMIQIVRTYRELFRVGEFRVLFAGFSALIASGTIAGLALATLVYATTGSPLLAALSLFGSSFAQVIGAFTVLSATDRLPPRGAMVGAALAFGTGSAALAIPGMPVSGTLLIILTLGLVSSFGGGVRWGLLAEILPEDGYILGRSVMNMSVGAMQIAGFAAGGLLIAVLSPRTALLVCVGLDLLAAVIFRYGLTRRPPRASGRASVRRTWRVNRSLWSVAERRAVYIGLWVPNGLIVGCEALFVPYAGESAGLLFIAGALGMLAGDTLAGRFVPPGWRRRLELPLRVLLAAPYLLFGLSLPLPLAVIAVVVASVGYASSLLLQERLIALTPPEIRGQALGLQTSGMMAMQAVGATLAGAVAEFAGAGPAMTAMAVASLLVSASLIRALRPAAASRSAAAAAALGSAE